MGLLPYDLWLKIHLPHRPVAEIYGWRLMATPISTPAMISTSPIDHPPPQKPIKPNHLHRSNTQTHYHHRWSNKEEGKKIGFRERERGIKIEQRKKKKKDTNANTHQEKEKESKPSEKKEEKERYQTQELRER